jgi:hypothetical protein
VEEQYHRKKVCQDIFQLSTKLNDASVKSQWIKNAAKSNDSFARYFGVLRTRKAMSKGNDFGVSIEQKENSIQPKSGVKSDYLSFGESLVSKRNNQFSRPLGHPGTLCRA